MDEANWKKSDDDEIDLEAMEISEREKEAKNRFEHQERHQGPSTTTAASTETGIDNDDHDDTIAKLQADFRHRFGATEHIANDIASEATVIGYNNIDGSDNIDSPPTKPDPPEGNEEDDDDRPWYSDKEAPLLPVQNEGEDTPNDDAFAIIYPFKSDKEEKGDDEQINIDINTLSSTSITHQGEDIADGNNEGIQTVSKNANDVTLKDFIVTAYRSNVAAAHVKVKNNGPNQEDRRHRLHYGGGRGSVSDAIAMSPPPPTEPAKERKKKGMKGKIKISFGHS